MPKASVKRLIECKKEQLIDLVLDIEKYPQFVPFCIDSKVYERNDKGDLLFIIADLTIGKGPFKDTYKSDVKFNKKNGSIYVTNLDGPLKYLENKWYFRQDNNITEIMTHSNSGASKAMNEIGVNACTDITGYGLLGHLKEMCESSKVKAKINFDKIPLIENAINYANKKVVPGGSKKNYDFFKSFVQFNDKISISKKYLISDAQTSGGLLISVNKSKSEQLIHKLKKYDCISHSIIGSIHNTENSNLIEVI